MNFNSYKFRCSSWGHIMADARGEVITSNQLKYISELLEKKNIKPLTVIQEKDLKDLIDKRDKKPELSATCKTYLLECYVKAVYGRKKDISNKYMNKGINVEADSVTLYSRVRKRFFRQNTIRLENDFIIGTPDTFEGEVITSAEAVTDIKSSWSIWTYFDVHAKAIAKNGSTQEEIVKSISPIYFWQLNAYGALTGANVLRLAYCLVDTPEALIRDEERKLFYRMQNEPDGPATMENPLYKEACMELRKTLVFDDIPKEERVIEFEFRRNDEAIKSAYARIHQCREYMNDLHKIIKKA